MRNYKHLRWLIPAAVIGCGILLLSSCTSSPAPSPSPSPTAFALTSTAFRNGDKIPDQYTCQGVNVSPPLSWSGVPAGTQSLALATEDMDGPSGIITHWLIFNIPPNNTGLPESVPNDAQLNSGALQGNNVRSQLGYTGPCPPAGNKHRYEFTLFALDQPLNLASGVTRPDFITALQGHIVAVTQLMGIYWR